MSTQGKSLSKLGKWAYRNEVTQGEAEKMTGLSHVTVSNLFNDPSYKGTSLTRRRLIDGLRRYGYAVEEGDFW